MEDLAREVGRLARQIEADLEELRTRATESNEPETSVLGRIERILGTVHTHTSTLVDRVPENLEQVLVELKRALILRLGESTEPTGPNRSLGSTLSGPNPSVLANQSNGSPETGVHSLTPQERRVFRLCFQSGFVTYRDIAGELGITPSAAKNLVNQIFQSDRKRPLFTKQYEHGTAKVGVRPDVERSILTKGGRRRTKPTPDTEDVIV